MSFNLRDWDGDGVQDWSEIQCGTNPFLPTNYCVTILGSVTNQSPFSGNFRIGCSLAANGTALLATTNLVSGGDFELPHVRVNAAGTLLIHLYDDANTNAALDAGEAFITSPLAITGQVSVVDLAVSLATCDKDADGMLDFWEVRQGLSWTNAIDACENPDGDGLINLHESWCLTDPWLVDGAQFALSDATLAIDSRIAGRNPTNALPLFVNYVPNGQTNVFIRNPDCWAADLDLTCCSPWNSYSGAGWSKWHRAGTLISPRHVLFAAHFDQIPTNCTLMFVDRQNNIVVRTLVAKKRHWDYEPYYPDITIGVLDSDVPTNQRSFARVLPDGFEAHLRNGAHLPVLRLDQEEKALVGDVQFISYEYDVLGNMRYSTSCIFPDDPIRQALYETVVVGDSGNPALLLVGGHPVLLTVWTSPFGGGGTSVTAFKSDINQLMTVLGGGYQLTEIDLSSFSPLP